MNAEKLVKVCEDATEPSEEVLVTYSTGKVFLTDGWYTIKDLKTICKGHDAIREKLLKSMEKTK